MNDVWLKTILWRVPSETNSSLSVPSCMGYVLNLFINSYTHTLTYTEHK